MRRKTEGALVTANVVCPGFVQTPLVKKQIPEQAKELGIIDDVADAVLCFAAARMNALTGQSLVVSHGGSAIVAPADGARSWWKVDHERSREGNRA